jgi:hypothetical protein
MVQAESSASASRNSLKAVTAGAPPDYELPWFVNKIMMFYVAISNR